MTLDALVNMAGDFRAGLLRLEAARNSMKGTHYIDEYRPVSIAITELENARMWAIKALAEQNRVVSAPDIAGNTNKEPFRDLSEARDILEPYKQKLRSEFQSGSNKGIYRQAIHSCHNHLLLALHRIGQQFEYLDVP